MKNCLECDEKIIGRESTKSFAAMVVEMPTTTR